MVLASHLRAGMAIRFDGQDYRVLAAEYHPGQGKMSGATHARLRNLATAALWEHSFRPDLKLEDLPVEKQSMDFLYADGDAYYFMNPETFEQVAVPASLLGEQASFLTPEVRLPVEFVSGRPVSVQFPEILEARIADTASPVHAQQDSTWKAARLENGVEILVPQFVKAGDVIRLDTRNQRYVDRARGGMRQTL